MRKLLLFVTMMPIICFAESVEIDGINYILIEKGNVAEVTDNSSNNIKDLVIPAEVTYNGERYTVVSIEGFAFTYNTLVSVEIPNTVTKIGPAAFSLCKNLEKVKIGSGVSEIGGNIFDGCSKLSSIVISKDNPFYDSRNDCNAVIETESNTLLFGSNSTIIPNTVSTIRYEAFEDLEITSIVIPNSVKTIGRHSFARCKKLKEVIIGDGVELIDQQAFENDESIKTVSIGKAIKEIGGFAFKSCPNIEDVYIYADKTPPTASKAFEDSHIEFAILHVPSSVIEQYKVLDPWNSFKEIVSIDNNGNEKQKCDTPTIIYKDGKLSLSCSTDGVEFVTNIENTDIRKYYDASIPLAVTYSISVYATKTGFEDSNLARATLCWIDVEPKMEGITNGVASVGANAVMIKTEEGQIIIEGADDNTGINVYNLDGVLVGSTTSRNGVAFVNTNLTHNSIAVVKIGNKSVKVAINSRYSILNLNEY